MFQVLWLLECLLQIVVGIKQEANPPVPGHAMFALYSCAATKPSTVLWVLGAPSQPSLMAVVPSIAPDASPGLLQSSLTLPTPPGYPGHKVFECPPPGKWCPIYHHLSLIVSDLEDTPHGTLLHRAIMLAYAFHDLWPSKAAAIFSFLARFGTSSCYGIFSSPFNARTGHGLSDTTLPSWN